MKKVKISLISEAALKECRDNGVVLTDENIITIYELGKVADSTLGTGLRYYNGIKVGNITLHPLTLGAHLWLEYEAKELCEFDEDMYSLAMVWAFAHSNDPECFLFESYKDLKKTILRWGKKITATDKEISDALVEIGGITLDENEGNKESDDKKSKKEVFSPMLNFLMSNYGKDVTYWLWEVNEDLCNSLIKEYIDSNSDKKTISSDDTSVKAFVRLKRYIAQLKEQKDLECKDGE